MKQITIIVLLVVAVIGGAVLLGGNEETAAGEPSNNFYGQEEGIITVTEYGDFECPACAGFAPIFTQVKEQFTDQVRFEYRHFPLVQIHPNAQSAHRAAQAAGNQGKFWEMHDLIYGRIQTWNTQATTNPASLFENFAQEIGLDMEQFKVDVASSETLATINADIALGKEQNVSATPTFLIDGIIIEDTSSLASVEGFAALVQQALDEKNGTSADATDETPAEAVEAKPEDEN